MKNKSIKQLMSGLALDFREQGRQRTSEIYLTTMNCFLRFTGQPDYPIKEINHSTIARYEKWMLSRGLSRNTSSFYLRVLRSALNKEVNVMSGIKVKSEIYMRRDNVRDYFSGVWTGVDRTTKRSLSMSVIKDLKSLSLPRGSDLDWARDMFLMSFYMRGMSFIDMAYLKPGNIKDGQLIYYRQKTGQKLVIRWEKCMQDILDRWPKNETPYLMPIITRTDKSDRLQYKDAIRRENTALGHLAKALGLSSGFTSYSARHSWATAAYEQNIPVQIISEALGHTSEKMTRIYLKQLDSTTIDSVNSFIINML